jgi:co-chaperonin GroES (HSP10)|tara:strand:+ start:1439 stop:1699 length:261 start_codon:yes stop_codon:yes gene_type:complete
MKAVGRNLIVQPSKVGLAETKGGLFLAEKQREDIRYAEGQVLSVGSDVVGIKEKDIIYYDKNNSHQIEIKKDIYSVVRMDNIVIVL